MWQIDINKQFAEILELNKVALKQQLQNKSQEDKLNADFSTE